jgi:hypothetical protein
VTGASAATCKLDDGGWRRPAGQSAAGSPTLAYVASGDLHRPRSSRERREARVDDWWATPRYPLHQACAAGQCIYYLAFDRHPPLTDALEYAACIDVSILAHCREPGEHVLRM